MPASIPDEQIPESDVDLIRRLLDGHISEEEFETIQIRLQSDTAFRDQYVQLVDLETALYEECSAPNSSTHSSGIVPLKIPLRLKSNRKFIVITLCTVCFLFVLSFLINSVSNNALPPRKRLTETPKKTNPSIIYTSNNNKKKETPDIAILTYVEGIDSNELKLGRCFKAGTLKIPHGKIKLEFFSGAQITIIGPAEIDMISRSAATLRSGRATAQIPESAIDFVINAPEAAVVDLGTEVGIQVDQDGSTDIDVIKGKAKVSILGNDGKSIASQNVNESQRAHVDQNRMAIRNKLDNSTTVVETPSVALPVREDYVDAIKQSEPLVYWRFESEDHGQVRNEMSPQWPANLIRNFDEPNSLQIVDGYARFNLSRNPRMIMSADPFPLLNEGPFSIEFWLKPDRLSHMTCLSVVQEDDDVGIKHLNVIEIMTKRHLSHLVHDLGNIRFLQRYPPSPDGFTGANLFSKERCTPGQWMQVVVVKKNDMLEMYIDGAITRRVFINVENEPSTYKLYLGQLRIVNTLRQFVGAIDEFALYKRILGPEEIYNHYRLMFW
ncbi:LamG-like jellyroll fold domain-containing protein [Gimesia aquarii]|uniref:FecR protein n=1 Tax=Gimesia aquarii TaxID=2527964 RepID=A0A517X0X8_9PLAN|nr:LamG-like jellyroll fold domain-containing protein [Gimesia aquarii]QDU11167.1 FecR protein [Gimesia aquarii]